MADNFVTLKIKATDDAKPDLDELRASLDEIGHKVDTAQVKVDDEDGKIKLADMNAKLAELNKKVANPKISLAGAARAQAEIMKIDAAMDHLKEKADKDKGEGQLSKLGAIGGMLFGVGEGADEGNGIIETLKAIATSPVGIAGITVALAAAAVEATGLISGFAAAGLGVGAFAALAIPSLDKIKTAYTGIATAQQAYHKAVLTESMDPTKANAAAVAKALLGLKEAWHGLDPAERGAMHGIDQFRDSYEKMVKAFEPDAFKVFNEGLKIANNLLPQLKPFADTAATAIGGLLKQLGKLTSPTGGPFGRGKGPDPLMAPPPLSGWEKFIDQMHRLEGPSITAIGKGIGELAVQVAKLLTSMSKKDVVNSINIAFTTLKGVIIGVVGAVRGIMAAWDDMQKVAEVVAGVLRDHMGGAVNWLKDQFGVLTAFWKAHSQQIETVAKALGIAVGVAFKAMAQVVKVTFQLMGQIIHTELELIVGIVGVVLDLLTGKWHKAWSGIANTTTQLLGNLRHLIATILDGIASLAFTAGQHIVQMLINGLKSMIGGVGDAIGDIGHVITSFLPFSPAKQGPLSGQGDPQLAGRRIAKYLAQGLTDGTGGVRSAMDRVAGAATIRGGGGLAGGGGVIAGGGGSMRFEITGGDSETHQFLAQMIRQYVRVTGGGNVQQAFGRG